MLPRLGISILPVVAASVLLAGPRARAQPARPTPLLSDDLSSNRRTKIDAPKDSLDAALDDALGGPQGFSTRALEQIEDRLRAELKRDRPRATPRLILFLYPGKVSVERLKAMTEINVDVELVMDPCERSVCEEAVGHHIELVGRAVGQAVLAQPGYRLSFHALTLKTATQMHGDDVQVYQVPIADCLKAAARPGGGAAWVRAQAAAEKDYEPLVTRAIARRAQERRVALAGVPSVRRTAGAVSVALKVRGDRARFQAQVTDALAAAAQGLKDNPKTPPQGDIEVDLESNQRGAELRRFRAQANPVGLFVERKLGAGDLWASYVEEVKKQPGAQRLGFDDAEASGQAPLDDGMAGEPDDNEAINVLAANFNALGACARSEAQRSSGFRGVTVRFTWTPSGRAEGVQPKEPQLKSAPIARCLAEAMSTIRLPRFSGGPRTIDYPIRVR